MNSYGLIVVTVSMVLLSLSGATVVLNALVWGVIFKMLEVGN